MTRLHLDLCGRTTHGKQSQISAFRAMVVRTAAYVVVSYLLLVLSEIREGEDDEYDVFQPGPFIMRLIRTTLLVVFSVFSILVTLRTRYYVRRRYGIPSRFSGEDFLCSVCCTALVAGQLARHTADYEKYPASCLSDNGLATGAPEVV